jgi:hypothetical protein
MAIHFACHLPRALLASLRRRRQRCRGPALAAVGYGRGARLRCILRGCDATNAPADDSGHPQHNAGGLTRINGPDQRLGYSGIRIP